MREGRDGQKNTYRYSRTDVRFEGTQTSYGTIHALAGQKELRADNLIGQYERAYNFSVSAS